MTKLFEILALSVSAGAFVYGIKYLFIRKIPKYFKLYTCACGCYMLEELWTIVNSLLGNGAEDGLLTVRLFGFFGCLCFMLSANANEFDSVVDEKKDQKVQIYSLAAPILLTAVYSIFTLLVFHKISNMVILFGFLALLPALGSSYFSLKHLILPEDSLGFLRCTRKIDKTALVFFAANYLYPIASLYFNPITMGIYDILMGVILFIIIYQCRKGAEKWPALI